MHDHTNHIFWRKAPQTQGLEGGPNPNSGFCTRCDAPKLDPRSPQELPRSSQDAPKLPTRSHQELPRSPQDAPKLVPRSHQKVPKLDTRCSQVGHILICTTIAITFFGRPPQTHGLEEGSNQNSGFCSRFDAPKLDPRSPQELPT